MVYQCVWCMWDSVSICLMCGRWCIIVMSVRWCINVCDACEMVYLWRCFCDDCEMVYQCVLRIWDGVLLTMFVYQCVLRIWDGVLLTMFWCCMWWSMNVCGECAMVYSWWCFCDDCKMVYQRVRWAWDGVFMTLFLWCVWDGVSMCVMRGRWCTIDDVFVMRLRWCINVCNEWGMVYSWRRFCDACMMVYQCVWWVCDGVLLTMFLWCIWDGVLMCVMSGRWCIYEDVFVMCVRLCINIFEMVYSWRVFCLYESPVWVMSQSPVWVMSSHETCLSHVSCVYESPVWVIFHVYIYKHYVSCGHQAPVRVMSVYMIYVSLYESCQCIWIMCKSHVSITRMSHDIPWVMKYICGMSHVCMSHLYESRLACVGATCMSQVACEYETMSHMYSQSHLGWHFRMLFQSSKSKARTSLLLRFSEKSHSTFEIWAFENFTPRGIGCTCGAYMSHICVYEAPVWVMSVYIYISHLYESCLMCVCVTCMSHVSCVYASYLVCVCVTSMSHISRVHQVLTSHTRTPHEYEPFLKTKTAERSKKLKLGPVYISLGVYALYSFFFPSDERKKPQARSHIHITGSMCTIYIYIYIYIFCSVERQKKQAGSRIHMTGRIYTVFVLSLFFFQLNAKKNKLDPVFTSLDLYVLYLSGLFFQFNTAKHKLDPVYIFLDVYVLHIFLNFQLKAAKHTLDFVYALQIEYVLYSCCVFFFLLSWTQQSTSWIPYTYHSTRRFRVMIGPTTICNCTVTVYRTVSESCHTYEWVMSHIRMSHVTHTNESCHTYEWVMSHIRMSHVTYMNESCHIYDWVMSHIRMSHVTHTNESCHIYDWANYHTQQHRDCLLISF